MHSCPLSYASNGGRLFHHQPVWRLETGPSIRRVLMQNDAGHSCGINKLSLEDHSFSLFHLLSTAMLLRFSNYNAMMSVLLIPCGTISNLSSEFVNQWFRI